MASSPYLKQIPWAWLNRTMQALKTRFRLLTPRAATTQTSLDVRTHEAVPLAIIRGGTRLASPNRTCTNTRLQAFDALLRTALAAHRPAWAQVFGAFDGPVFDYFAGFELAQISANF
jgi:hypothetical protein